MRVIIQSEQQLERIQTLKGKLRALYTESDKKIGQRVSPKKWSVLEVVKHMEIGHNAYQSKIQQVMDESFGLDNGIEELRSSAIPSFLIKRFPPKEKVIRLKMRTSKKFEPLLKGDENAEMLLNDFMKTLEELEGWIRGYREKGVKLTKFSSAIGPIVSFNVPEASEFILCHNERHFQQIENTLQLLKK